MLNSFQHLIGIDCGINTDIIEDYGTKWMISAIRKDILHEKQVFGKRCQTSSTDVFDYPSQTNL